MQRGYLVDIQQEREQEAVRRLLELSFISERFFWSLGLNPYFSWYLLQVRVKENRLVSSLHGEVDILAGRFDWSDPEEFTSILAEEARNNQNSHPSWHYDFAARRLAESSGIKWPPSTDYLVGIEAKCAYFHPLEDTIKSPKSSEQEVNHIRSQIDRLLQMGFNKVALLDIIANFPESGIDGQAWLAASNTAITSKEKMSPILDERLPEDSPAGHWVWPTGSVIGGDESMRGAGSLIELRAARENPFLEGSSETQSCRQEMEKQLNIILAKFPLPRRLQVIFIDCTTCHKIHGIEDACTNGSWYRRFSRELWKKSNSRER